MAGGPGFQQAGLTGLSGIRLLFKFESGLQGGLPTLYIFHRVHPSNLMKGEDPLHVRTGSAVGAPLFIRFIAGVRVAKYGIEIEPKFFNADLCIPQNGRLVPIEVGQVNLDLFGVPVSDCKSLMDGRVKFGSTVRVDRVITAVHAKTEKSAGLFPGGDRESIPVGDGGKDRVPVGDDRLFHIVLLIKTMGHVPILVDQGGMEQFSNRRKIDRLMGNRKPPVREITKIGSQPLQFQHMLLPIIETDSVNRAPLGEQVDQQAGGIHSSAEADHASGFFW